MGKKKKKGKKKTQREGESNLFLIITLLSRAQMFYIFSPLLFAIYTLHMTCQKKNVS